MYALCSGLLGIWKWQGLERTHSCLLDPLHQEHQTILTTYFDSRKCDELPDRCDHWPIGRCETYLCSCSDFHFPTISAQQNFCSNIFSALQLRWLWCNPCLCKPCSKLRSTSRTTKTLLHFHIEKCHQVWWGLGILDFKQWLFSVCQISHIYITCPSSGKQRSFLRLWICYRWISVLAKPWICFWSVASLVTPTPWQVWAFQNRNVVALVVCGTLNCCGYDSESFFFNLIQPKTKGSMGIWRPFPDVWRTIQIKTQNADLVCRTNVAYFKHLRREWAQSFLLHSIEQFDLALVFPRWCYAKLFCLLSSMCLLCRVFPQMEWNCFSHMGWVWNLVWHIKWGCVLCSLEIYPTKQWVSWL